MENENPPPSYNEAMSQPGNATRQDNPRPDGWVEGYVEAPGAEHLTAAQSHSGPIDEKTTVPSADAITAAANTTSSSPSIYPSGTSEEGSSAREGAEEQAGTAKPQSVLSFGGLTLGSKVLGFGYGNNVGGVGVKIGSLMLGLVDTGAEEEEDKKPEQQGDGEEEGRR